MLRIATITTILLQLIVFTSFADGNFTLSGTITNRLADEISISYVNYENGNWLDYTQHQVNIIPDENGDFKGSFTVPEGYTLLTIQNGDEATEIYAHPGYKINMTVDGKNFDESIKYTGEGSSVANFMAAHMQEPSSFTHNIYRELQQLAIKEPKEYLAAVNDRIQKELDFLINNGGGLPQSFIQYWDDNHEFLKYSTILSYPNLHEAMKKQSYDIGEIPEENFIVLDAVPEKFDDKYISMQNYRNYIGSYYYAMMAKGGVSFSPAEREVIGDRMVELSRKSMPTKSEQYVYANHLRGAAKASTYIDAAAKYDTYKALYGKTPYNNFLEELLAIKKKTSKGSPAIDMTFTDQSGKKVNLSDLKGKVVYLDFWASWCGPCKAQFPHTAEIKEHFKGKDVVFAYVSIDENKENWEKAKEKFRLSGLHNLADGAWKAKEADEYGIQSVPSYFLIDKNGNFATDHTPRPSQKEELIALIEELL